MSNVKKTLTFFSFLLLTLGFSFSPLRTLGITLGAIWGICNIFFLKQFLENLLLKTKNKNVKLLIFTLIKFPLLYLAGFGLLSIKRISPLDLLIGFTLVLIGTLVNFSLKFQRKGAIK